MKTLFATFALIALLLVPCAAPALLGEPEVGVEKAIQIAKKELAKRKLTAKFFISSVKYASPREAPATWTIDLTPKGKKEAKSAPRIRVLMDASVIFIKGK